MVTRANFGVASEIHPVIRLLQGSALQGDDAARLQRPQSGVRQRQRLDAVAAAGVAAALAGAERCAPRAVPIAELQATLRRQLVLLRTEVEPALAPAGETAEAKS